MDKGLVEITSFGFETLDILTRYMSEFVGAEGAESLAMQLIDIVQEVLSSRPESCPICHELELLGVVDYKQLTFDNYKILYRYDSNKHVSYVMAFMRQRQSAQELLIQSILRMDVK